MTSSEDPLEYAKEWLDKAGSPPKKKTLPTIRSSYAASTKGSHFQKFSQQPWEQLKLPWVPPPEGLAPYGLPPLPLLTPKFEAPEGLKRVPDHLRSLRSRTSGLDQLYDKSDRYVYFQIRKREQFRHVQPGVPPPPHVYS